MKLYSTGGLPLSELRLHLLSGFGYDQPPRHQCLERRRVLSLIPRTAFLCNCLCILLALYASVQQGAAQSARFFRNWPDNTLKGTRILSRLSPTQVELPQLRFKKTFLDQVTAEPVTEALL